jgi:hypothetical protein
MKVLTLNNPAFSSKPTPSLYGLIFAACVYLFMETSKNTARNHEAEVENKNLVFGMVIIHQNQRNSGKRLSSKA